MPRKGSLLNDIKPSEDSNNKATEEKIKKIFGNFHHFPCLLTVIYVWDQSSDDKPPETLAILFGVIKD